MSGRAIRRLLIANRGEIAVRIARTARRMGIETVAVFSDAEADAPHVRAADRAVRLGPAPAAASYANAEAVLAAAAASGADALHPGYGFLAEDASFAERCAERGIVFVGPSPAAMRALGDKASAKRLLAGTDVPLLPGYDGEDQSDERLAAEAARLGAPLMIKASAGGGGRGMRLVVDAVGFAAALAAARSEALATFGSSRVLLERALIAPRHVEVQIFGDHFGSLVHLGERDCSVQRRHQKLIEETPSPAVDAALRARLIEAALTVARAASYENAGTVEFLLDGDGDFFFIEVNARLQVEHTVTEAVTGLDLVEWQLRVASGEPLPARQDAIRFAGHAIEARLCAEDSENHDLPQAGRLGFWQIDASLGRVDHALESGIAISPDYDSMIAKLVVSGADREAARRGLLAMLDTTVALGVPTNRDALQRILGDATFAEGRATTAFLDATPPARDAASGLAKLALAAALRYRSEICEREYGEFGGWSSTARPPSTIELRLASDPAGDATVFHVSGSADDVRVETDGLSRRIAVRGSADAPRVAIDDEPWFPLHALAGAGAVAYASAVATVHAVERGGGAVARAGSASLDGVLRAPMNGRIARVDAVAGERLAAGTVAFVLEAMKMEHHVALPADVVVRNVATNVGTQVRKDEILLHYDLAPPAPSARS